eukprot:scaffold210296_cov38-Prasinocladus_malaysianus.AAC.1
MILIQAGHPMLWLRVEISIRPSKTQVDFKKTPMDAPTYCEHAEELLVLQVHNGMFSVQSRAGLERLQAKRNRTKDHRVCKLEDLDAQQKKLESHMDRAEKRQDFFNGDLPSLTEGQLKHAAEVVENERTEIEQMDTSTETWGHGRHRFLGRSPGRVAKTREAGKDCPNKICKQHCQYAQHDAKEQNHEDSKKCKIHKFAIEKPKQCEQAQ